MVDCPTRMNRTMDLFYTNAKEAYAATPLPPLGKSNHNLVQLQPTYIPLVKMLPITTRQVRRWSPEVEESLRDCFQTTDWDVIVGSHGDDVEGAAQCITDYMNFCTDVVVPVRTVKCFTNNKPWVTKEVKNRKKRAFRGRNREEMREAQNELRLCLREAKEAYRRKLENQLSNNQVREVWCGMKAITGYNRGSCTVEGSREQADALNTFFNRFNSPAPTATSLSQPPFLLQPSRAPIHHPHGSSLPPALSPFNLDPLSHLMPQIPHPSPLTR